MSTETRLARVRPAAPSPRAAALLGLATLTLGYVATLYWIASLAGGTTWLLVAVGLGAIAAVAVRSWSERRIAALLGVAVVVGAAWYFSTAAPAARSGSAVRVLVDTAALASGIELHRLAAVDVWIAVVVPVPVFLSTYLALRRRYALATAAAGWFLLFLALTGDATLVETLVGAVGAVALVGFGELDRRDASLRSGDVLVVTLALMALLALLVPLVPAGDGTTLSPGEGLSGGIGGSGSGAGAAPTAPLDDELHSGGAVRPSGPVELSPDVRFVATVEEERRWRVDVLDHYDGDGYSNTLDSAQYPANTRSPPGPSRSVEQTIDLRAGGHSMPHANYPVAVDEDVAPITFVTEAGALRPGSRLTSTESYTVRSEVPDVEAALGADRESSLSAADRERYTQVPETLPDRVGRLSANVTGDADTSYEAARRTEVYLRDNWEYSLNVTAPEGDLVDGFLYGMDEGYCTYFAASMATMLRTQDVPARVAVGYDSGQWVDENTTVVRGTDAHAWVEVYVEGAGWIEFDPTPESDWEARHGGEVEAAREAGVGGVDVPESEDRPVRFDRPDPAARTEGSENETSSGENSTDDSSPEAGRYDGVYSGVGFARPEGEGEPDVFEPGVQGAPETEDEEESVTERGRRLLDGLESVVVAVLLLAGTVALAHRAHGYAHSRPAPLLVWQRRRDPETDARVAMDRIERVLARRYGPRRPGETRREYVTRLPRSADDRVDDAVERYERVRYAGAIEAAEADALVRTADELTRASIPVVGRYWR